MAAPALNAEKSTQEGGRLLEVRQGAPQSDAQKMMAAKGIFIVGAKRTPFGAFGGKLKAMTGTDLAVHATQAALKSSGLPGPARTEGKLPLKVPFTIILLFLKQPQSEAVCHSACGGLCWGAAAAFFSFAGMTSPNVGVTSMGE